MGPFKELRYQHRLKKFEPFETVHPVEKNGKWGFKKRNATKPYIKHIFSKVEKLTENIFLVQKTEKTEKYGLVDALGFQFVSCKYDCIKPFVNGFAAAKRNGLWGFIDENGKEVISCVFSEVGKPEDGFVPVCKKMFWGFVYYDGRTALPCKFDKVEVLENGFKKAERGGQVFYFDRKFNEQPKFNVESLYFGNRNNVKNLDSDNNCF